MKLRTQTRTEVNPRTAQVRTLTLRAAITIGLGAAYGAANANYVATMMSPFGNASRIGGAANGSQVGLVNGLAAVWNSTPSSYTPLYSSGLTSSNAIGTNGATHVGIGSGSSTGNKNHALMWNGSANSFVDLHPTGFDNSIAYSVSGNSQVGMGGFAEGYGNAILWNGSAASAINLNPAGFTSSIAYGVSGSSQVGQGFGSPTDTFWHALLWTGTASSYVDLNPTGYLTSRANAVDGVSQVGWASPFASQSLQDRRAFLWNGSSASAIALNPSGFNSSDAFGVRGNMQVGRAEGSATGGNYHALLWNGSASSYTDLHLSLTSLPAGFIDSAATSIDSNGDIYGWGTAADNRQYALKWSQPVPEPGTMLAIGGGIAALLRRRRKN